MEKKKDYWYLTLKNCVNMLLCLSLLQWEVLNQLFSVNT